MILTSQDQVLNIINNAPTITPDTIFQSMGAEAFGDASMASTTYHNMWYTYENSPQLYRELYLDPYLNAWESGSVSMPSATEALIPEAEVNGLGEVTGTTASRFPATETASTSIKQGALSGRIPIASLVGATAIGAGIGIKEVASHRKFWDDISNAVFRDLKNWDLWTNKPFTTSETEQIIWRALEDGGIASYCDKRSIDKIVKALYQMDAFNVIDHIDQETTEAGTQVVEIGATEEGFVNLVLSQCDIGSAYLTPYYGGGLARWPDANVTKVSAYKNTDNLYGVLRIDYYSIPAGTMEVYGTAPNGLYINATDAQKRGNFTANINPDGTVLNYSYQDGPAYAQTVIDIGNVPSTVGVLKSSYVSNVGSQFVPKNPNVIYNGTDTLPPSDIDQFWTTFAGWLANGFTVNPYDPIKNAIVPVTYVPITLPDINYQVDPLTGSQTQTQTGIYSFVEPFTTPSTTPETNPSPWIFKSIGQYVIPQVQMPVPTPYDNNPLYPQPTPTPSGDSPSIVAPTSGFGSGSKLFTVYNPTQSNLDSLGAYLWQPSIIQTIEQFFKNSPLDAIISLHIIYCEPTTGSNKNIVLGYLDSSVSAPIVTSQYEDVECGYVEIPELYGNVLDYTGVTIQLYLPFIGWKSLKVSEVMGKRISISYKVDVYTGVCLAMVHIISANTDQILYTFEGNCSVQIPLTASDRTRIIGGLITAGVSAFTGNPAGVVGGIASMSSDVNRSGGFSGNAGAMGVKKPYIVIARVIDAQASNYNSLYGYPLNKSGFLINFRGYTRVSSVHVDIPTATDDEIIEIESMLKDGIII